jgi:hypothetical protein
MTDKHLPLSETGACLSVENKRMTTPIKGPATQPWVHTISFMQQSVLLGIVRGPDNTPKYHPVKPILRWYRRCLLVSALDGEIITDPSDPRGGSFTGPSIPEGHEYKYPPGMWEVPMNQKMDEFMQTTDAMPVHFLTHMLHAVEIMGYKHGDDRIRQFWRTQYERLVAAWHLYPETEEQLDRRLGDSREGWLERSDPAITK